MLLGTGACRLRPRPSISFPDKLEWHAFPRIHHVAVVPPVYPLGETADTGECRDFLRGHCFKCILAGYSQPGYCHRRPEAGLGSTWIFVAAGYLFISARRLMAPFFKYARTMDVRFSAGVRLGRQTVFGVLFFLRSRGSAGH